MSTYIMKSPDRARAIFDNEIAVSGYVELHVITCHCESGAVGYYHPFLGEDCAALEGVQRLRAIPGGWKGFCLDLLLGGCACGLGEGEETVHFWYWLVVGGNRYRARFWF